MNDDGLKRARYSEVERRLWNDARFRSLSPIPPCGQGLWLYLLTTPELGSIPGLIVMGESAMAEHLDWPIEAFREAFREVFGKGMAEADWRARVVVTPKAIEKHRPQSPNVVISWRQQWLEVPDCELKVKFFHHLKAFVEGLGEAFREAFAKAIPDPSPNQDQDQEQEQKQQSATAARRPEPDPEVAKLASAIRADPKFSSLDAYDVAARAMPVGLRKPLTWLLQSVEEAARDTPSGERTHVTLKRLASYLAHAKRPRSASPESAADDDEAPRVRDELEQESRRLAKLGGPPATPEQIAEIRAKFAASNGGRRE